jgi:16S rRNA (cytosine1402-N4)-methyltransferase
MHRPVLFKEVLEALDPHPGDFMIDGTVDGGNHAAAIIERILPGGTFLGVDWDERMIEARQRDMETKSDEYKKARADIRFVHANYADIPEVIARENLRAGQHAAGADGLFLDLGFSSEQLEVSGRGFSFKEEFAGEPLLMTYNDDQKPVAGILRELDEEELANIIYEFGGERGSRRIAKAIKDYGRRGSIKTAGELAEIVRGALPKSYERGRIDPATRTFQALRIYANDELKNLKRILDELPNIMAPGGRAVILSFHSLEDGIVKRAFQALAKAGTATLKTKKPLPATREEIKENPRSRSAKLRAIIFN